MVVFSKFSKPVESICEDGRAFEEPLNSSPPPPPPPKTEKVVDHESSPYPCDSYFAPQFWKNPRLAKWKCWQHAVSTNHGFSPLHPEYSSSSFERAAMSWCNYYLRAVGADPKDTVTPQNFALDKLKALMTSKFAEAMSSAVMRKLEGIFGMYLALSRVVDEAQFAGILLIYAQTFTNESLIKIVYEYAADMFSTNIDMQAGDLVRPQATPDESEPVPDLVPASDDDDDDDSDDEDEGKDAPPRPVWLDNMAIGLENWKMIIHNPGFDKVSRLLTLLVTMGFFGGDLNFNIANLTLFSIGAQQRHVTAVDLIDAIFETIAFFGEGAYNCFQEGSLKPLLFSSSNMVKMEKQYNRMLELWEYARNGNLRKFADMDESKFDKDLQDLTESFEYLYKTVPNGTERKIYCDRWRELSKIRAEFNSVRIRGGLRVAPWTFKLYGTSGVGKSTVADIFMVSTLKANGYPGDDDHIITIDTKDKHMANARTYITGFKLDDVANAKIDQTDINPSDWLIMICNNVRRYAIMADLANKGKISIEPAVVSITTNVESMAAELTSNEPLTVVRRAHQHWWLRVRPKYCRLDDKGNPTTMLDSAKVVRDFGSNPIPDVWLLTHRSVILDKTKEGKPQQYHFENDPRYTNVSIHEALKYNLECAAAHFDEQRIVVDTNTNIVDKIDWCKKHNTPSQTCGCYSGPQYMPTPFDNDKRKETVDKQFGTRLAHSLLLYSEKWQMKTFPKVANSIAYAEELSTKAIIRALKEFESSVWSSWTTYIPDSWFDNRVCKAFVCLTGMEHIQRKVYWKLVRYHATCFPVCYGIWQISPKFATGCFLMNMVCTMWGYGCAVEHAKGQYIEEIRHRRDLVPEVFKDTRESYLQYACGAFAGFAVAYGAYKTYKAIRNAMSVTVQDSVLKPRNSEDIRNRDLTANPWKVEDPKDPGVLARVGKAEDWTSLMTNSVMNISYQISEEKDRVCHCFILTSNIIMIPAHFLPEEPKMVTITGRTKRGFKWNRSFVMNKLTCATIDGCDMALCCSNSVGVQKDMLKYFLPECEKRTLNALMYHRDDVTKQVFKHGLRWTYDENVWNGYKVKDDRLIFPGSWYELPIKTFGGLCMAPIIADTVHSGILGFHLGGNDGTDFGCGGFVSRQQIKAAKEKLRLLSRANAAVMQAADIPSETYGIKYKISEGIHEKSPTRYIGDDAQIEVYGSVKGRVHPKSNVVNTIISDTVTKVTGLENKWGPPQFDGPVEFWKGTQKARWHCWQHAMAVASHPSPGFDPVAVDRAVDDYLAGLRECFDAQKDLWKEQLKPLTEVETVSGRDGQRFIDGMVMKTSMGYPIGGPKRNWVDDLDPNDFDDILNPRTLKPEVWEEVKRLIKLALEGKCLNTIFSASLKDEPVKRSKYKVRVFQAAPIALQILLRMHFLPVCRFISMNPLVSECAVGINALGKEWEEMSNHAKKYGEDRIIAGDFSKYDLRMPAQLTVVAMQAMIEIATWSGNYSEEDLTIMNALITEVCYPLVAYNGDLVRFIGTNPSGHNLTVYVNSIANSILHRLGLFNIYPEIDDAREVVALVIYGDDSKGSVKIGYDLFNMLSFSQYLAEHDIIYTSPTKTDIVVPYMHDLESGFLKRMNTYRKELSSWVGVIEEDSIVKSLHTIVRSRAQTNAEVSTQNIEGALREWFFYGEEVYEKRRREMRQVAEEHDLPVRGLDKDYAFCCNEWRKKENVGPQCGEKSHKEPDKKRKLDLAATADDIVEGTIDTISCLVMPPEVRSEVDLQDECIRVTNMGLVAREYVIGSTQLGQGDLIFQKFIEDWTLFLVVETKSVVGKSNRPMAFAKKQARKYGQVISCLRPEAVVLSMVYTEFGYEFVHRYGPWRKLPEEVVQLWS